MAKPTTKRKAASVNPTTAALLSQTKPNKYKANVARGEFIHHIGDRECLIRPDIQALANIESDTAPLFQLAKMAGTNALSVSYAVMIFYHLNQGDPVTPQDIYLHFMSLFHQGRANDFGSIIQRCMNALCDPAGLSLQEAEVDDSGEPTDPN